MKSTITILILLSSINLYAISKADIDKEEQSINHLNKVVTDHYNIIKNSRIESVQDVLKRYSGTKASLVNRWFDIVTQTPNNPSTLLFIYSSKRKIKFYLEQMLLDSKNPMSQKDYNLVSQKIMSLGQRGIKFHSLNKDYITTTGVNVRNLPIFLKSTKQIVIQAKSNLTLLYTISYTTQKGEESRWGYFKIKKSGQRGWINLKNTKSIN